ncbi:MAG: hypothetical protein GXZ08_04020 [Tissierellia bacterium]|nr:hypothetical protein [Tissierellia bacterium]
MRTFFEKLLIALLCTYSAYIVDQSFDMIPYLLIVIIISTVLDLVKKDAYELIIYGVSAILCLVDPSFVFFMPLILYNLSTKYMKLSALSIIGIILFSTIMTLFTSILSIYLSLKNREYQNLVIDNKKTRDNLKEDTIQLKTYNQQLIVEKEKDIEIAILKERNRISKELHESVGHLVSSSILQVEALSLIADSIGNETLMNGLNILQDRLSAGMKDIRYSIHNLHSQSLDLEKQIKNIIDEYPNIAILLKYDIREDLNYSLKFDILSIVKEAIINTNKHSDANSMNIDIMEQPKFITISINDNGTDTNANITTGIGLIKMQEIASKYKGFANFKFDNGFILRITLMKGINK